jgi:hypothetical protein
MMRLSDVNWLVTRMFVFAKRIAKSSLRMKLPTGTPPDPW